MYERDGHRACARGKKWGRANIGRQKKRHTSLLLVFGKTVKCIGSGEKFPPSRSESREVRSWTTTEEDKSRHFLEIQGIGLCVITTKRVVGWRRRGAVEVHATEILSFCFGKLLGRRRAATCKEVCALFRSLLTPRDLGTCAAPVLTLADIPCTCALLHTTGRGARRGRREG